MKEPRYAIFGAGGFGREVLEILLQSDWFDRQLAIFVDLFALDGQSLNGIPVASEQEVLGLPGQANKAAVAIANPKVRASVVERLEGTGWAPMMVQARTAEVVGAVSIGPGAILCQNSLITDNAKIGSWFHLNYFSYVAHDCVIGDFVTFAPRVSCNGNVTIEDGVFVGAGAVIRPGTPDKPLRIGAGAIIGAGAVVIDDVPEGATVVGNPAREIPNRK